MWAMRKDSARGVSWRYGVGLLYLECVWLLVPSQWQAPLKRPGRQMELDARWFLAIPDNKRNAKAR